MNEHVEVEIIEVVMLIPKERKLTLVVMTTSSKLRKNATYISEDMKKSGMEPDEELD